MTYTHTIPKRAFRRGTTLIELIIVVSISVIVLGLVAVAVSAAREASRRTKCSNNLRQIQLGFISHNDLVGHLPTGGWGRDWIGVSDRGFSESQPGGWIFNSLPFVERATVRELGVGPNNPRFEASTAEMLGTRIPLFNCPSRRPSQLFECKKPILQSFTVDRVAKSDYAANGGDRAMLYGNCPLTFDAAATHTWIDTKLYSGVSFLRSRIAFKDITDGLSHTYMVAEKHLDVGQYYGYGDKGDNESMYSGDDLDLIRFTGFGGSQNLPPLPDKTSTRYEGRIFGSAHPNGFVAAMCDGQIIFVSFAVDTAVHSGRGNRADGRGTH